MFDCLLHMLKKEFIQTFRDPRMRAVIIIVPLLQTLVFGYAVTTDVRNIKTVIMDFDNTPESRELINAFQKTGYFNVTNYVIDQQRAFSLMDKGEANIILSIPHSFKTDIERGKSADIQIILDGSNAMTAGVILGYSKIILSSYIKELNFRRSIRSTNSASIPTVGIQSRSWFNPNLKSRYFYLPGVIAMIVMIITLILSSMSVVREKEIGTIEQIMVTPISKMEFILGKTIPFAIIGMFDVLIVTAVAVLWFQIPFLGNLLLLLGANALFLLSTLGVGLLISTMSSTQQQAMLSTFFFTIPAMMLSGFIFPISNMPKWIQILTYLNPLRYMIIIIRGIFLKGIGLDILWFQFLAMGILGIILLTLSAFKFRKTL